MKRRHPANIASAGVGAYFHLAWWCSLIPIPLFLMLFWVLEWEKQTPAKE